MIVSIHKEYFKNPSSALSHKNIPINRKKYYMSSNGQQQWPYCNFIHIKDKKKNTNISKPNQGIG